MSIVINPDQVDFSRGTPVVSSAMKFILPVPARDRVLALRADFSGELARHDGAPLPFAKGSLLLKHPSGGYGVIPPEDLAKSYRSGETFRQLEAGDIAPLLTAGGMVVDPDLCNHVASNVAADAYWARNDRWSKGYNPHKPANNNEPDAAAKLLNVMLMPYGPVSMHVRHAVDAVVMDRQGRVLLIEREHNPGAGKLALPGGFIDLLRGGTEGSARAALRELAEETGLHLPVNLRLVRLGNRRTSRPFDVREAWRDMPDAGIKKGDYFGVTTQPFAVIVDDLTAMQFKAGDDARKVVVRDAATLDPAEIGIDDHLSFVRAAQVGLLARHAGWAATARNYFIGAPEQPGGLRQLGHTLRRRLSLT